MYLPPNRSPIVLVIYLIYKAILLVKNGHITYIVQETLCFKLL